MSVFIGYPSFMAYQMMKGKKGNNDGFPSIPGTIARYSALGLTNEQMATRWLPIPYGLIRQVMGMIYR